jgi:excisionase family DNA binding protein
MSINKEFISTTEAAKILGVSRIAVFNRIKAGKIPAEKVGRNFVIKKRDVLEAAGALLTNKQKKGIDKAVTRAAQQYGEVFGRLGKE